MVSTVKNTTHKDNLLEVLEQGLSKGSYSDVLISVSGSKKTILCHRAVLARTSPFMASLVSSCDEEQEQLSITLCDITFTEAMAMLNLVYVGSVRLASDKMEATKAAARTFLGIEAGVEKIESKKAVKTPQKRKLAQPTSSKVNAKRPLMIKTNSSQAPIFFVMPANPALRQSETPLLTPPTTSEPGEELTTMNSYQRAKLRCADKFKCDLCGKGFPLSCLLQRHKRTHLDQKPFSCNYCEKSFSSKTSLNHHLFMKHLEEQTKRIEMGKKLIENLKQGRVDGQGQFKRPDVSVAGKAKILKEADSYNMLADHARNIENMEIIGVEDITQQIAVQMTGKEKVDGVEVVESVDNLYYIDAGHSTDYWGQYKP